MKYNYGEEEKKEKPKEGFLEINYEDGTKSFVKKEESPAEKKEQKKWEKPQRTSYINPNIGIYPDKEGYNKEVRTVGGVIIAPPSSNQNDQGTNQNTNQSNQNGDYRPGYYSFIKETGDYSDYYSTQVDLINRKSTLRNIFSKANHLKASRENVQKQPRILLIRKIGTVGVVITMISLIIAAYLHVIWNVQAALILAMVGMAILTDVMKVCGRMWSQQTRIFIFLLSICAIVPLFTHDLNYLIVDFTLALLFYIVAKKRNAHTLFEENWLLSPHVQHGLVNRPDTVPVWIWNTQGFREARTLLHEIGVEVDDVVLEGFARPLVILGISIVLRKMNKLENEMDDILDKSAEIAEKAKVEKRKRKEAELKQKQLQDELEYIKSITENNNSEYVINELIGTKNELETKVSEMEEAIAEYKEKIKDMESKLSEEETPPEQTEESESKDTPPDYRDFKNLSEEDKNIRRRKAAEMYESNPRLAVRKVQLEIGIPFEESRQIKLAVCG